MLLWKAFQNSYAKVASAAVAIAARGWNPLTYNLLLHPQLIDTITCDKISEKKNGDSKKYSI